MTLAGLRAGDIIEVDLRGRRFHATVQAVAGGEVKFRPLERNVNWTACASRQVVGIWRANAATRRAKGLE